MPGNVPITPEKEEQIRAALEKDRHASRVARRLGDVRYATVWRAGKPWAIRHCPAELWRKVEIEVAADAEATQQELSRKIGVSRPTVGRAVRARRAAVASGA
jgi:hypothetical protein